MTDNSNPSIEEVNCVDVPSSVETDKYKSYIDENMNSHVVDVDKVLGRGGQGIVYRTEDPNIALKLALKDSNEITDPSEIEHFRHVCTIGEISITHVHAFEIRAAAEHIVNILTAGQIDPSHIYTGEIIAVGEHSPCNFVFR